MMSPRTGYCKPADARTSTLCNNLRNVNVDIKYQNNLVSRGGTEVYCYPSPLHAVALQSPIFYLSANQAASLSMEPQEGTVAASPDDTELISAKPEMAQTRQVGYINKILQRSTSKLNILNDNGQAMVPFSTNTPHSFAGAQEVQSEQLGKLQDPIFFQESTMLSNNYLEGNKNSKMYYNQNLGNCVTSSAGINSNKDEPPRICHSNHTTISREFKSNKTVEMVGSATRDGTPGNPCVRNPCERYPCETRKRSSSKPPERRPKVATASEDNHVVPSEFVHAQFVPAGSQHVKIQQADRKTKAVRLRRRSCDKPRGSKHLQKLPSRERERETSSKLRVERNSKSYSAEKMLAMHSCSETSIPGHLPLCCSSSQSLVPTNQAAKCGKTCRPHQPSSEHLNPDQGGGRRRQCSQRHLSASEVRLSQSTSHNQRSKEVLIQGAGRRSGMRPQSGHWGGSVVAAAPRSSLKPSISASSYFCQMNARYPPAPCRGPGSRYPPRCESELSEYSAECASLFHSTIAESSEGEHSDYTANRFGDSESSQGSQSHSDSDSSLSLCEEDLEEEEGEGEEGGLVWAEATLGPTAAGLPLPESSQPEPLACRIKASRALKKKIRRFQPASLKVMTLV